MRTTTLSWNKCRTIVVSGHARPLSDGVGCDGGRDELPARQRFVNTIVARSERHTY